MTNLMNYFNSDSNEKDKAKIINQVYEKTITYPSEIASDLLMDTQVVLRLVNILIHQGKLKRAILNPDYMHPKLAYRLHYFWGLGMIGFRAFVDKSWIEINDEIPEGS